MSHTDIVTSQWINKFRKVKLSTHHLERILVLSHAEQAHDVAMLDAVDVIHLLQKVRLRPVVQALEHLDGHLHGRAMTGPPHALMHTSELALTNHLAELKLRRRDDVADARRGAASQAIRTQQSVLVRRRKA